MKRKLPKELLSPEQNEIMRQVEYLEIQQARKNFAVDLVGAFCFGGLFIGALMVIGALLG